MVSEFCFNTTNVLPTEFEMKPDCGELLLKAYVSFVYLYILLQHRWICNNYKLGILL